MSKNGSDAGSARFRSGSRCFPPLPSGSWRGNHRGETPGGRERQFSPRSLPVVPGSRPYRGTTPGNHLGNHLRNVDRGGGGQSSASGQLHRGDSPPPPARAEDRTVKLYLKRVEKWPPAARAEWEEQASIMEYDGGLPRAQAELAACTRIILAWDLFPPN